MVSWKWPALVNKIFSDVPGVNVLLNALLKQDPAGTTDIPAGAKRWADGADGKQFQVFNGSTWESAGKLDHDVASVDGKSVSVSVVPDTIPVRDANGQIPGDISGNAATATKANELSEANPVAMGGTGATTAEQARANLGTPPKNHAASSAEYGAGTSVLYGHLKSHDEPDSTLTAASGHAFSPAGAAAMQEALGGLLGETQGAVSSLDSTLRALIAEEVAKYLPLAGGVMTGGVEFDRTDGHIFKRDSEGRMVIRGGAGTPDAGASVYLYGADHPDTPGRILLQSVKPSGGYTTLDIDKGKALIDDKNVVRSVNGFEADGLGGVQINAISKGNVSADVLTAQGVYFVNGENTNLPSGTNGYIAVDSVDGQGFVRQIFYRAGTVDANDYNIYTRQRGSNGVWGAWVKMLTSRDGEALDSQSIGSEGYMRYKSGLQICWGNCVSGSYKSFPKAFSAKPVVVPGHSMSSADGNTVATGAYIETSRFFYKSTGSSGGRYIAVGSWA